MGLSDRTGQRALALLACLHLPICILWDVLMFSILSPVFQNFQLWVFHPQRSSSREKEALITPLHSLRQMLVCLVWAIGPLGIPAGHSTEKLSDALLTDTCVFIAFFAMSCLWLLYLCMWDTVFLCQPNWHWERLTQMASWMPRYAYPHVVGILSIGCFYITGNLFLAVCELLLLALNVPSAFAH